ncbi:UDP-2,4-diacetamido-2,4,6-trideoxy-beta-L-altropyranose hydrolase [Pandoraea sp. NPDC087047]|uniref:UDP-2,4-diacetamido-2,4, 6-trideoxy-beta-L-altropyranose hydrolase n=1 Tax=Pandoraea sp. NPDC087047 TaxID=3364390 RepID=UPI00381155C4
MKVAFRADASTRIGTGHIMRCLSLADQLAARGARCLFVCRAHEGHLLDLIVQRGHEVRSLPGAPATDSPSNASSGLTHADWLGTDWRTDAGQTHAVLAEFRPDWLVIDHYAIDSRWEDMQRDVCARMLAIDDLADRQHNTELLVDPSWYAPKSAAARYVNRVGTDCECLLGPKYALLKPAFANLAELMPPRDGLVRRLFVFMGGADADNETAKVLRALMREDLQSLVVDVVIGRGHPDIAGVTKLVEARPGTRLHIALPSLAGLMARADMAIGGGGGAGAERLCMGLPSLVISLAENQVGMNRAMQDAGYVKYLGESRHVNISQIADGVVEMMSDPSALVRMSRMGQEILPGRGSEIVAARLFDGTGSRKENVRS